MKCDLHVHTTMSDGLCEPSEIVYLASMIGLDCIAITDHNTIDGWSSAIEAGKMYGVQVIPGIEVGSKDGHILGIGVSGMIARDMSAADTVKAIHDAGGVAIAPHPFSVNPKGVRRKPGFDAIEVWNGGPVLSWIPNMLAIRYWFANSGKFAAVGSTDTHYPITLGSVMTLCDGDDIIKAIRDKKTSIVLNPLDYKHLPRNLRKKLRRVRKT